MVGDLVTVRSNKRYDFRPMSDPFTGYDLETGILQRVRRWRDALPILILPLALRVAGSPLYVGLCLLAALMSRSLLTGAERTAGGPIAALAYAFSGPQVWSDWLGPLQTLLELLSDFRWIGQTSSEDLLRLWAVVLVWGLPAATLARAGACYAAGRDQSFLQNLAVALRRWLGLGAITAVPIVAVLGLSLALVVAGALERFGRIGMWISELAALLALPLVILIGMLTAGAFVAVPLAWTAVAVEKRSDAIDSLSRGYEYLFRRPIQLVLYSLCGYGLAMIVFRIAQAVSSAGMTIATAAARSGSGNRSGQTALAFVMEQLPLAVGAAAAWGMLGALYLLMRQSANQQEVEDIAVSPVELREAEMPTLKTGTNDSTSS